MNPKLKWFFIISGYVVVFLLTFIWMGGLDAIFQVIQEIGNFFEDIIAPIIELLPDI